MTPFRIDSPLELHSLVVLSAETVGEPQTHVYFSRIDVAAGTKNAIIIVTVNKNVPTPLLPHGVRAHVSGQAVQVGDVVVVTNPTLRLGPDDKTSPPSIALKNSFMKLEQVFPDVVNVPELAKLTQTIANGELSPQGTIPGVNVKEFTIGEGGVPTWSIHT